MARLILIDTATAAGSVSFAEEGQVVASFGHTQAEDHAAYIADYVYRGLSQLQLNGTAIDAIAVSAGPGSYTGLRVGLSTAKGLCYAWNCRLILLPTMEIMAAGYRQLHPEIHEPGFLVPVLKSRKNEVYAAVYKTDGTTIEHARPVQLEEEDFSTWQNYQPMYVFGEGADRVIDRLQPLSVKVVLDATYQLHASHMAGLAEQAFRSGQFADLAYAEPYYLKPTYVGKE
ncbi:MAG: tRNA (adenosine(37)-N6)-threonylcarbamoyltransferase complex dimerization subunit type 1 TsaB [Thermoflavifilum aggregans]|nr:tRNA (adenosine(37)-N6)-threonylcarbamoyltransferase complex dimerization subunit type 1 TsaB [Thermoflavifilum aggregans]